MERKQSIINIESHLEGFIESISKIKKEYNSSSFFHWEVLIEEVIADMNVIVATLKYLVKSYKVFVSQSTTTERGQIISYLSSTNTYISQNNTGNAISQIEALKVLLRGFYTPYKKDFVDNFIVEIEKLQWKKVEIENIFKEAESLFVDIEETEQNIDWKEEAATTRLEELNTKILKLEQSYTELSGKLEQAKQKEEEITRLLTESRSNEWLISSFSTKVVNREKQLEEQELKTKEYETKLKEYEKNYIITIEEAKTLIETAKKAMNYKTAEWISASIQEQYDKMESKWTWLWLIGSGLGIVAIVILGWKISESSNNLIQVLARVSLVPVLMLVVYFCWKQYNKIKNITYDYAYKKVLTQSIVWFSEQLLNVKESSEWYQIYIKKMIEELLKDPLRELEKEKKEIKIDNKLKWLFTDIVDIIKPLTQK